MIPYQFPPHLNHACPQAWGQFNPTMASFNNIIASCAYTKIKIQWLSVKTYLSRLAPKFIDLSNSWLIRLGNPNINQQQSVIKSTGNQNLNITNQGSAGQYDHKLTYFSHLIFFLIVRIMLSPKLFKSFDVNSDIFR